MPPGNSPWRYGDSMWTTFWPDILGGIVVAALSGLATVGFGWLAYRHERKRHEQAAMRRLIGDFARRRALEQSDDVSDRPGVKRGHPDFDYVTSSIFQARTAIDEARVSSRDVSDVHPVLDEMTAACNSFLRASRREPTKYVIELDQLRSKLAQGISRIRTIHPGLPCDAPGGKAVRVTKAAHKTHRLRRGR